MNVSALAVFLFCLATTLFGEDTGGPVITVRKGTSQQVEIKEIGGQSGGAATGVLKNDIQLSGAKAAGEIAGPLCSWYQPSGGEQADGCHREA